MALLSTEIDPSRSPSLQNPVGKARIRDATKRKDSHMAKKITGITRLQLPAGQAADGSLMGQAMRRHGVNVAAFCNAFNAATASDIGLVIPVVVTIYEDRSFSFVVKNPLVSRAESATREPAARI
jgi:hypothetical protein